MQTIKVYVKNVIKLITSVCFRILLIFPVKSRRLMFTSYWGEKIGCNPKCVYDYLVKNYPGKFQYIWTFEGPKNNTGLDKKVKVVRRYSPLWFYYRATSQVIIDNYPPTFAVPKRKDQFVVQTWHAGGAYKKLGIALSKHRIEKHQIQKSMSATDLFVSSSWGFTQSNIICGYHYHGAVIKCGMPRNDIFFYDDEIKRATDAVKTYYGIKQPILLYAPTYRGRVHSAKRIYDKLDIKKLQEVVNERFGREVKILVRYHYLDKNKYDFDNNVIDAGDYLNMQELLCASDILITDYSSSIWDFALLGRPCLFYVPDLDQYVQDTGFFTPIEQWPGIECKNVEELCDAIRDIDFGYCAEKAKNYLKNMGSYETGKATEIISNRIIDFIRGD